jgi:hypothetical protein
MFNKGRETHVIVTGGRDYQNQRELDSILFELKPETIAAGDATGADKMALNFGSRCGCWISIWKANWSKFGLSAGPKRNRAMLTYFQRHDPLLVVFPGGKGTKNCFETAKSMGIRTLVVGVDYVLL